MNSIKETGTDRLFNVINYSILLLILIIILYPIWFVLIASISNPDLVNTGKVYLFPKGITFEGYKSVLEDKDILISYKNTIVYTVVGTSINLVLTLMTAYALSKKRLYGRNVITFFFVFTMFFRGGLIPTYLVVTGLGMYDTMWGLIIPGAIGMYNVIIARTFFQTTIPNEIEESAAIDGCSTTYTFIKIVLPLTKALIAVLALFYAVEHWNAYFNALIFLSDRKLFPLQMILREILIENTYNAASDASSAMEEESLKLLLQRASLVKYSVIIFASLPVLMIYPFTQKYFVGGIMIGSLKG